MVNNILRMVTSMKDSTCLENSMVRVHITGVMGQFTKVNLRMGWETAKVYGDQAFIMVIFMKDSMKTIWSTDMEYINGLMAPHIKGISIETKSTEKES